MKRLIRLFLAGVSAGLVVCGRESEPLPNFGPEALTLVDRGIAATPEGSVTVVWVFGLEDCLTCTTFDIEVRHLQRRFGQTVRFLGLLVGLPSDTTIARNVLDTKRIDAEIMVISERDAANIFGSAKLPFVYATYGEKVLWQDGKTEGNTLTAAVAAVLGGKER